VNRRFETGFSANQNKGRRSRFIAISLERDWKRCNTNLPVYSSPVWTDLLPFLLGGVLKHHLDAWEEGYPEILNIITFLIKNHLSLSLK
jgi:hypothetical protein